MLSENSDSTVQLNKHSKLYVHVMFRKEKFLEVNCQLCSLCKGRGELGRIHTPSSLQAFLESHENILCPKRLCYAQNIYPKKIQFLLILKAKQ